MGRPWGLARTIRPATIPGVLDESRRFHKPQKSVLRAAAQTMMYSSTPSMPPWDSGA